jgi:hypothetical protein
MNPRTYCAYNQTRECFLGLEVAAVDLSFSALVEKLKTTVLRSGQGLWIAPFHGLPTTEVAAPLDLFYLDAEGRVLEMVESFPTFRAGASCPRPASVLALPAHSIYSSQTQPGDQLVVCVAEEMEQRLAGGTASTATVQVQGAVLLRQEPLWSGGPGVVELESDAGESAEPGQKHEMDLINPGNQPGGQPGNQLGNQAGNQPSNLREGRPGSRTTRPPRNWLERWWSPDPRKAPREPVPGLAAYYWNGAAPVAHGIRDISSSGIYVVTEERWYPGTLVLMTLQHNDSGEEGAERSIAVQTRAVRWGHDGVGLQFVLPESKDLRRKNNNTLMDAANRKEFDRFLQQLKRNQ